ncbi:MAG: GTPase [Blastochloris sp.]|nr:GTPase [Blastochloris sp.]
MIVQPSSPHHALLSICLLAAYADGTKSSEEREEIRRIAADLGSEDFAPLSRQILLGKVTLASATAALESAEHRLLAYEMALGLCEAGGEVTPAESAFLDQLSALLQLETSAATQTRQQVESIALAPVQAVPSSIASPPDLPSTQVDNSPSILKYAILNGALELLPETLATVAIIPLQMKMVYGIGKSHNVELDRGHLKEFLATAGIGLGSQVVEGFARKLIGRFARQAAGSLAGKIANQATGSAFSFATTYALGHLADHYYAGGRRLDTAALRTKFTQLQEGAQSLYTKHLPEIRERARTLNPSSILALARGTG